ncbi:MAG: hypothetical protein EXX96DRAFT_589874 [Benjaminiella poitrasii]|nr:MAG: hypothetical protein EXX96DRAFT_589874 [Benjaminiella poitrasii]
MYFWDSPKIESVDTTNAVYLGETLTHHVSIQMIITAALASACSTGALSFLLSPYVNSIYLHTEEDENAATRITPNTIISIETLDILARQRTTTLKLRELSPVPQSSLLTWKVNKKVLAKELNLIEQGKGEKRIHQHRFWLDQRNGVGDREAMSNILRVINEQGRKRIFL